MKRLLLPLLLALASPFVAHPALADVTSPGPVFLPTPQALTLRPLFGEPTATSTALAPPLAVLPLRLSMLGSAFPRYGLLPGDPFHCNADASGNSSYGFPVEHEVYLAMTSQLALHGFSRLGCPLDAVMGGAVTYAVPLDRDVTLVASAGSTTKSTVNGRARTKNEVRLDLMMKLPNSGTLGVGVGARKGRGGLAVTGSW